MRGKRQISGLWILKFGGGETPNLFIENLWEFVVVVVVIERIVSPTFSVDVGTRR